MTTAFTIGLQDKLIEAFAPSFIELVNESDQHGTASADSHFKVTLVSTVFEGERALQRHRRVHKLLANELDAGPIHALALHLYTPTEWQQAGQVPSSPQCLGGSKLDSPQN
ncbi:BolA family protein [Pseudidiomarina taiwanensis]|uniref:BolA family transcriptional regulator n=1 Tax=Pseudidiomarina taiwanensis TaxID=337250 RepID=A0A432ZK15_9GAMM|nr:BolA/IbaG family iron-sulfur metabolism protein [Pseudidiomarina taiwanensis]RUO78308.1 BolA family transcriptional regulator [Pseudidiomarina taiwanensis]